MAGIFDKISKKRAGFSNSYKKVADYLTSHYEEAAFMPAASIAQEAQVSESVVIRFAKSIGYAGFPEMKRGLQKEIQKNMTLPQKMRKVDLKEEMSGREIFQVVMTQEYNNVLKTMKDPYNLQGFDMVVEKVSEAETVYVVAVRTLDALALVLENLLGIIGKKVVRINPECSMEMQRLMQADERGLAVMLSFARYDKRIRSLQEFFQQRGTARVTITDNPESPDVELADCVLYTAVESHSYTNSYCALVALFHAIVAAVGLKDRERAIASLELMENMGRISEYT